MSKEARILEDALKKATERTPLTKKRRRAKSIPPRDLPIIRHEHAIIRKVPTETPNLVPVGVLIRR